VAHQCIAFQIPIAVRNQEARIGQPKKAASVFIKLYIYSKLEIKYNIRLCKTVIRTRITFLKVLQVIPIFRAKRCLKVTPLVAIKKATKVAKVAIYEKTPIKRDMRPTLAILRPTIPGLIDQTIAKKVCSRPRSLILGNKLELRIATRCKSPGQPRQRAPMISEI